MITATSGMILVALALCLGVLCGMWPEARLEGVYLRALTTLATRLSLAGHVRALRLVIGRLRANSTGPEWRAYLNGLTVGAALHGGTHAEADLAATLLDGIDPGADPLLLQHLANSAVNALIADGRYREALRFGEALPPDLLVEINRAEAMYNLGDWAGAREHLAALEQFGPTPLHRLSYAPVALVSPEARYRKAAIPEQTNLFDALNEAFQ